MLLGFGLGNRSFETVDDGGGEVFDEEGCFTGRCELTIKIKEISIQYSQHNLKTNILLTIKESAQHPVTENTWTSSSTTPDQSFAKTFWLPSRLFAFV